MTDALPNLDRRHLLAILGSLPLAARPDPARAATAIDTAMVMIAGPDGGSMDRWGHMVQPALAQSLPPEATLRLTSVGAADGVTGANQFLARGEPDGRTVLMAPGEAAAAWLVGDPRAQFDVAKWVSVMAGVTPGIVIARPNAVAGNREVRLGVSAIAGGDLAAVLGIDLLGAQSLPVAITTREAQIGALHQGQVDAVFLRGHRVAEQAAALMQAGAVPVFSLGARDEIGRPVRCTTFPDVPTLPQAFAAQRGPMPGGPLFDAWSAAAAASQLEFALVLPHLTPASAIALWRRAGAEAAAALDVRSTAMALGVRPLGGPEATAAAGAISASADSRAELRRWLAIRFNWRPA